MSKKGIGSYRLGRTLGVGSFSKVKFGVHEPTGKRVAIKVLNKRQLKKMEMEHKVYREIEILAQLNHPHVIRLYEMIETSTDIYVIMEYVPRGELFDYIVTNGRLNETQARRFFQQIIAGIQYCHAKGIVHRDLKPENLLLDDDYNLRIADFGLSNTMKDGFFLKTSCGSPNYAAPEVICDYLYAGPEVDIWSCGVILYALLCGSLPFDDENIPNLFRKIKSGDYVLPTFLSDGARNLIKKMLYVNPMKRITIAEIREDEWFKNSLPKYLHVDPFRTIESEKKTNSRIVELCANMGYSREEIEMALKKGYKLLTHSKYLNKKWARLREAAVCYHLHFDKHYRIKLAKDIQKSMDGKSIDMNSLDIRTPDEQQKNYAENARDQLHRAYQAEDMSHEVERTFEDKNYSVKWKVGLWTTKTPYQFMQCVLDNLKKFNMEWYYETPYCIWARTITSVDYNNSNFFKPNLPLTSQGARSDSENIASSSAVDTENNSKADSDDTRSDHLDADVGPLPNSSLSPKPQQSVDDSSNRNFQKENSGLEERTEKERKQPTEQVRLPTLANEDSASSVSLTELVETPLRMRNKQDFTDTQGGTDSLDASHVSLPLSTAAVQNIPERDVDAIQIKLQLYLSRPTGNPAHMSQHRTHSRHDAGSLESHFLLDIQKIDGDTFPFLDLCTKFMSAIRSCPLTHLQY